MKNTIHQAIFGKICSKINPRANNISVSHWPGDDCSSCLFGLRRSSMFMFHWDRFPGCSESLVEDCCSTSASPLAEAIVRRAFFFGGFFISWPCKGSKGLSALVGIWYQRGQKMLLQTAFCIQTWKFLASALDIFWQPWIAPPTFEAGFNAGSLDNPEISGASSMYWGYFAVTRSSHVSQR